MSGGLWFLDPPDMGGPYSLGGCVSPKRSDEQKKFYTTHSGTNGGEHHLVGEHILSSSRPTWPRGTGVTFMFLSDIPQERRKPHRSGGTGADDRTTQKPRRRRPWRRAPWRISSWPTCSSLPNHVHHNHSDTGSIAKYHLETQTAPIPKHKLPIEADDAFELKIETLQHSLEQKDGELEVFRKRWEDKVREEVERRVGAESASQKALVETAELLAKVAQLEARALTAAASVGEGVVGEVVVTSSGGFSTEAAKGVSGGTAAGMAVGVAEKAGGNASRHVWQSARMASRL